MHHHTADDPATAAPVSRHSTSRRSHNGYTLTVAGTDTYGNWCNTGLPAAPRCKRRRRACPTHRGIGDCLGISFLPFASSAKELKARLPVGAAPEMQPSTTLRCLPSTLVVCDNDSPPA